MLKWYKEMAMEYSPLIEKAIQKAIELHTGQTRKHDSKTAFIVHPVEVALFLSKYTQNPIVLAAALLHDTLEDTPYTKKELLEDFGEEVANLVLELTEPSRTTTPWKKRKEWYINHLQEASLEARMISCADKINNLASMIEAYRELGESMWEKFNSDKTLWYYHEILKVFEADERMIELAAIYRKTLEEAHLTFAS